jgi:hypothetical protein
MMGRQDRDQRQLFYEFSLDEMIPADHLLRRRGDGEFLFLAEGRPIKRKAYCTRSNAGTDASDCIKQLYHTIRLRSVRIISGYGMAACGAKRTPADMPTSARRRHFRKCEPSGQRVAQ